MIPRDYTPAEASRLAAIRQARLELKREAGRIVSRAVERAASRIIRERRASERHDGRVVV